MFSRNSIFPFPHDRALSAHINGDHDHVSGTSLIVKKKNWVEQARKISFGTMSSPNLPGLTFLLNKTFPFPTAEQVFLSHRYSVQLCMDSYSSNMLKNDVMKSDTDHSENRTKAFKHIIPFFSCDISQSSFEI